MRLPFSFFTRTHGRTNERTDERTNTRTQPGVIIDIVRVSRFWEWLSLYDYMETASAINMSDNAATKPLPFPPSPPPPLPSPPLPSPPLPSPPLPSPSRIPEPECRHLPALGHPSEEEAVVAEREAVDHPDHHHLGCPGGDHK